MPGERAVPMGLMLGFAGGYILVTLLAFRRRDLLGRSAARFALLNLVAALWQLYLVLFYLDLTAVLYSLVSSYLVVLGAFLLADLFLLSSTSFLNCPLDPQTRSNFSLATIFAFLISLVDIWLHLRVPYPLYAFLTLSPIIAAWVMMVGGTYWITAQAVRRTQTPAHRNRVIFWAAAWALFYLGQLWVLLGWILPGSVMCFLGLLTAGYILLIHNVFDLAREVLRALSYIVVGMLAIALYAFIFYSLQTTSLITQSQKPLVIGLVTGILMVFVFHPLLSWIFGWVNRLLFGIGYSSSKITSRYIREIGPVVDINLLVGLTLKTIEPIFHPTFIRLYLVDHDKHEGEATYFLHSASPNFETEWVPGVLPGGGPLVGYFQDRRFPVSQYDIDFLPAYQGIHAAERAWLDLQKADVFVPVYTEGSWNGLLVLGPKKSGDTYDSEDLLLLNTMAEQAGAVLEKARMFSNLLHASHALETANQQLLEMDQLKSAFLGVVTHELRTPLANAAFSLQLLEMYGKESMSPDLHDQAVQLGSNLKTARSMVDNLILFASFTNRQVRLTHECFEVRPLLLEVLGPLREWAVQKGVIMRVDIIGSIESPVADRKLIGIALQHLVENAIHFTPANGRVLVSCWQTSGNLCVDVSDTGPGIPPEKLPALWDGFKQAADPLRRGAEGLGVGLALVRYILAAHGGRVWVESQVEHGSSFGFLLPVQQEPPVASLTNVVDVRPAIPTAAP